MADLGPKRNDDLTQAARSNLGYDTSVRRRGLLASALEGFTSDLILRRRIERRFAAQRRDRGRARHQQDTIDWVPPKGYPEAIEHARLRRRVLTAGQTADLLLGQDQAQ